MTTIIPRNRYSSLLNRWPFDDFFDAPLMRTSSAEGFKMDVEDAGDAYVVCAELPNVERDQIDIELNEGRLSISVEKTESEEQKNKNYLYKETSEWSATRGVYLKDAATSGLTAKLDNGVLTVNIPKQKEKGNVTKIAID